MLISVAGCQANINSLVLLLLPLAHVFLIIPNYNLNDKSYIPNNSTAPYQRSNSGPSTPS